MNEYEGEWTYGGGGGGGMWVWYNATEDVSVGLDASCVPIAVLRGGIPGLFYNYTTAFNDTVFELPPFCAATGAPSPDVQAPAAAAPAACGYHRQFGRPERRCRLHDATAGVPDRGTRGPPHALGGVSYVSDDAARARSGRPSVPPPRSSPAL